LTNLAGFSDPMIHPIKKLFSELSHSQIDFAPVKNFVYKKSFAAFAPFVRHFSAP
jgi:hypothetical protein